MYTWNQLGRRVNKGEKGIRILAPVIGIKRKKDDEAAKDVRVQNQSVLVGFRSVYVFDVSQTEGLELPELSSRVSGDVGERMERLLDLDRKSTRLNSSHFPTRRFSDLLPFRVRLRCLADRGLGASRAFEPCQR